MGQIRKWTFCKLLMVIPGISYTQSGKISGYIFGDYYYMASNHNKALEDENGFWFRRIYFTYDQALSEGIEVRFRIERFHELHFTISGNNLRR